MTTLHSMNPLASSGLGGAFTNIGRADGAGRTGFFARLRVADRVGWLRTALHRRPGRSPRAQAQADLAARGRLAQEALAIAAADALARATGTEDELADFADDVAAVGTSEPAAVADEGMVVPEFAAAVEPAPRGGGRVGTSPQFGLGPPRGPGRGARRRARRAVAAVGGMTAGLAAVTESAAALREQLDRQAGRQEALLRSLEPLAGLPASLEPLAGLPRSLESVAGLPRLLEPLAALPAALAALEQAREQLPEATRVQTEVLRTLRRHVDGEAARGDQIADLLDRMARADADHRRALDGLTGRVEAMSRHDRELCERLAGIGAALEAAARRSAAGVAAMEQLGEQLARRDRDLARLVERQNLRWATLVVTAGVLSVAALTAVMVFGYLMLTRGHG